MIAIRSLGPDDWETWRDLRLAALLDAPHAFQATVAEWRNADESRWRARLSIPGAQHVIACLGEDPVGMASGVPSGEEGVAELISMWVRPDARGQKVGEHVIEAVERWGLLEGFTRLRLRVRRDNGPAIRFYLRRGFTDVDLDGDDRLLAKDLHLS